MIHPFRRKKPEVRVVYLDVRPWINPDPYAPNRNYYPPGTLLRKELDDPPKERGSSSPIPRSKNSTNGSGPDKPGRSSTPSGTRSSEPDHRALTRRPSKQKQTKHALTSQPHST